MDDLPVIGFPFRTGTGPCVVFALTRPMRCANTLIPRRAPLIELYSCRRLAPLADQSVELADLVDRDQLRPAIAHLVDIPDFVCNIRPHCPLLKSAGNNPLQPAKVLGWDRLDKPNVLGRPLVKQWFQVRLRSKNVYLER